MPPPNGGNSPLQKSPDGLLEAFDLKTLGQAPDTFSRVVYGMVDVLDFYTARQTIMQTASGASGAFNATIANITVPANQIWLVRNASIVVTRAAADAGLTLEAVLALIRTTSTIGQAIFNARFEATPATDLTQSRNFFFPRPVLALPGSIFRLTQRSTMTAGGALGATLDVSVMAL